MADAALSQAVAEVLVRYASGIDRRDWPLLRSCFADDCDADYGDIGRWHGAAEITDFMARTHEPCGYTLHRITNVSVARSGAGATSRSYVDAIVMSGDNHNGVHAVGFYDDELTETTAGWQITRRRFTPVLMEAVTALG